MVLPTNKTTTSFFIQETGVLDPFHAYGKNGSEFERNVVSNCSKRHESTRKRYCYRLLLICRCKWRGQLEYLRRLNAVNENR